MLLFKIINNITQMQTIYEVWKNELKTPKPK